MITVVDVKNRGQNGEAVFEMRGKSTDTKPVGSYEGAIVGNGSSFFEIDTFNLYMFDGETQTWNGEEEV